MIQVDTSSSKLTQVHQSFNGQFFDMPCLGSLTSVAVVEASSRGSGLDAAPCVSLWAAKDF